MPLFIFRTFDDAKSVDELQEKYVDEKIDQFLSKKNLIWRTFLKVVDQFSSTLNQIDEVKCKTFDFEKVSKKDVLIFRNSFESVDISPDDVSTDDSIFRPLFLVDFSLDFSKCPVTVCLIVGPLDQSQKCDVITKTLEGNLKKSLKEISLKNEKFLILIDVTSIAMQDECLDNWQHLWADKKCLDPPFYSHDLVIIKPNYCTCSPQIYLRLTEYIVAIF